MNLHKLPTDRIVTWPHYVEGDKPCDEGFTTKFCRQPALIADPANEWMTEFDDGNHHACFKTTEDIYYCECERCGTTHYGPWEETGDGYFCPDCLNRIHRR